MQSKTLKKEKRRNAVKPQAGSPSGHLCLTSPPPLSHTPSTRPRPCASTRIPLSLPPLLTRVPLPLPQPLPNGVPLPLPPTTPVPLATPTPPHATLPNPSPLPLGETTTATFHYHLSIIGFLSLSFPFCLIILRIYGRGTHAGSGGDAGDRFPRGSRGRACKCWQMEKNSEKFQEVVAREG